MNTGGLENLHRRAFLQRSLALASLGGASSLAMQLAAAGEASAFSATDYRAIVCIFLFGGNDYANTVIPYDLTNYDLYNAVRGGGAGRTAGGIAYGHTDLAATALTPGIAQTLTDNLSYALNPNLKETTNLFQARKTAILLNAGPLIVPLTKAQYESPNRVLYPLPPKLFSHNDQQSVWQSQSAEGSTIGWGGRLGDLALSSQGSSLLTCISASGNSVFVSGRDALQYQISPSGAIPVKPALAANIYGNSAAPAALKSLITQASSHVFENDFAKTTKRSMDLEAQVNAALAPINLTTNFDTNGQANPLANQLKIVARLIGARNTLGVKRQVFFVSLGGFDNHDNLMQDHPRLMGQVDEAMNAFYQATVELGVANQVTSFTASDFGRTLSNNGNGSDHGWGGHHFVTGGAVKGGQFYGTAPHVSLNTDDQVGQGRLLPTMAVDQIAATLAQWFGVAPSELSTMLPRIGNFASNNLGFMA